MLLNTRHIAELIEKGEISEIKEAMEKSMSPGSQTFEQALFKLFMDGKITQDEAMANADSADQPAVAHQPGDRRRDQPASRGRRSRRPSPADDDRGEEGRRPLSAGGSARSATSRST